MNRNVYYMTSFDSIWLILNIKAISNFNLFWPSLLQAKDPNSFNYLMMDIVMGTMGDLGVKFITSVNFRYIKTSGFYLLLRILWWELKPSFYFRAGHLVKSDPRIGPLCSLATRGVPAASRRRSYFTGASVADTVHLLLLTCQSLSVRYLDVCNTC